MRENEKVFIIILIVVVLVAIAVIIAVKEAQVSNNPNPNPNPTPPNTPVPVTIWNLTDSPVVVTNGSATSIPALSNVTMSISTSYPISYTILSASPVSQSYNGTDTVLALTPTTLLGESELTGSVSMINTTTMTPSIQITDGSATNLWTITLPSSTTFSYILPIGYNMIYLGTTASYNGIPSTIQNVVYYDLNGVGTFEIDTIQIVNNYSEQLYMYLASVDRSTGHYLLSLPTELDTPVSIPKGPNLIPVTGYINNNVAFTTDTSGDSSTVLGTFFPMSFENSNYTVSSAGLTTYNS